MKYKLIFTLMVFFVSQKSYCVISFDHEMPLSFNYIEVDNGLSNNDIICCTQDKYGFMWFGTRDGLNRYDGNSVKVYKDYQDTSGQAGGNWINCLSIDKEGYMWLGTDLGVYQFNHYNETFVSLEFTKKLNVREIVFDDKNNLWMILGNTLIKYNTISKTHQIINHPYNYLFTSLSFTKDGQLWVSTTEGLVARYIIEDNTFVTHDLYKHSPHSFNKLIEKIEVSPTSPCIYVGTASNGMKIFNINDSEYKDVPLQKNLRVNGFLELSANELWVASLEGLYIYQPSTGNTRHYYQNKDKFNPLSSDVLFCINKDSENGIWIGTYNGGVNYCSPYHFFRKDYNYLGNKKIDRNIVHTMEIYNNELWVGTQDMGIIKYDIKTGESKNYQSILSDRNIHGLKIANNQLWVGTSKQGVVTLDINSGKVLKAYPIRRSIEEDNSLPVVDVYRKRDNQMLVATRQGLFQYNNKQDKFELMNEFPAQYHIQTILEDHKGVIWGGTFRNGLYYYDPNSGKSGKLQLDSLESVSANVITDIHEDKTFNLWIATRDGIRKYDRKTRQVKKYSLKDGLPSNVTFQIQEDSQGNMWISTTEGLACLNPATEKIRVFTTTHGIPSNQFNYNSSAKDINGNLYFGTIKGMFSFKPENLTVSAEKPTVYLTKFFINKSDEISKSRENESITFSKAIELKDGESTFRIDFSALTYIAPQATEYAYYLDGFEKDWNYVKSDRSAHYTKLPPGQYKFMVKASNVSGIWNDQVTTLTIRVLPPWWKSTYAVIFYILLSAVAVFFIAKYFSRQNKKKLMQQLQIFENEKEKELYKSKIDFFINIAHEIRTPLTLIKGPLDKIIAKNTFPQEDQGQLTVINKNTNYLLSLVNQLLDFRKAETAGYRLNFVNYDIVDLIRETAERFRGSANQEGVEIKVETDVESLFVFIDKEGCVKILSNLLSNAVKYTNSFVLLSIKQNVANQTIIIDIMNDGESIPDKINDKIFEPFYRGDNSLHKSGTGLGLPLAKSLAEMHQGTLSLVCSKEKTTIFRFSLPIFHENRMPVVKNETGDNLAPTSEQTYSRDSSRDTILIVEDNKEMQRFLGKEINEKYNVCVADNGEEALMVLNNNRIQLIVTDIMMPVMDGFGLLKRVKTDIEFSHIPVVLLTAQSTMQSKLDGLEYGADAYIEKPFSSELLFAQISNLLANRKSIREFYFHSPVANLKSMANTRADEVFLNKLNEIIHANISNELLDVDMIAEKMNTTRSTLYRKINAISNLSPNDLIKITRLKKAAELLSQTDMKIYEISDAIGFSSQPYFSREFTKQFKMSPTDYIKKCKTDF